MCTLCTYVLRRTLLFFCRLAEGRGETLVSCSLIHGMMTNTQKKCISSLRKQIASMPSPLSQVCEEPLLRSSHFWPNYLLVSVNESDVYLFADCMPACTQDASILLLLFSEQVMSLIVVFAKAHGLASLYAKSWVNTAKPMICCGFWLGLITKLLLNSNQNPKTKVQSCPRWSKYHQSSVCLQKVLYSLQNLRGCPLNLDHCSVLPPCVSLIHVCNSLIFEYDFLAPFIHSQRTYTSYPVTEEIIPGYLSSCEFMQ